MCVCVCVCVLISLLEAVTAIHQPLQGARLLLFLHQQVIVFIFDDEAAVAQTEGKTEAEA